ncbi:bifunctional glutamate N-acetyltransferase/amino-acid acetyltransferase ArgJ [Leuconostoc carnosum]|uniref:bifunctional glutamate N-acetyltransferase/amino-acid acetyltransferase ArgJ n=1 Tax=Leuconostoc carnosum TaxID=1252 RepID=UPI001238634D|nr:bifunctional glutamate N-acetyltransferase/amino-acid acetyltransferase ArgJ [Leuconostoc carnosum]KAA8369424.1 bifunctional glutamate N-acetyltransferase/amino-acid acetyltransferase ArgJ [Leuconostoc carnosum]KAA8380442.1 bifunctional glutamate N-acetyltransferase/amino-acid acetyltransferase ArgJ [Leuconostoc carnosum]
MTELLSKITQLDSADIAKPIGFHADGQHVGLKHKSKDLGWIFSDVPAAVAGVFTTNQVQAAPIKLDKETIKDGLLQAIIVNSGNANAVTGKIGHQHAKTMQQTAADSLNIDPNLVAVASTGIIGQVLPIDKVVNGIHQLHITGDSKAFAHAIMTTDTVEKSITIQSQIDGHTVTMSGVAKGSGMLHPNMATMLGFITTDASISPVLLQKALSEDVETSFNQITIDGDTSTNDTVLVMANGQAEHDKITTASSTYDHFKTMLHTVTTALSIGIASDGEGATKLLAVTVKNSESSLDARMVAKKVVGSSLVKTAMFGKDPNWGRIIAAIGASDVTVDPDIIDISLNTIPVMTDGAPTDFNQEAMTEALEQKKIAIDIDLHNGSASGQAWGSDLTYDYVKINALYST